MHKLLEVHRRNFARARPTISLAPLVAPKGVLLVDKAKAKITLGRRHNPPTLYLRFSYVKREEVKVETAIQNFRELKLAELKEAKQRAYEDSQAFTRYVFYHFAYICGCL